MAFAAQLMVARVMKSRQGELLLPAGLEVKVAASLLGLFLGALILLFPFTPWRDRQLDASNSSSPRGYRETTLRRVAGGVTADAVVSA